MTPADKDKPKSARVTFFLCLFLGMFGIHRFYVGKIGTGILMLITAGGLGIWIMIDLGYIVCNKFQDSKNNILILTNNPSALKKIIMSISSIIAGFLIFFITFATLIAFGTSDLSRTVHGQLDALEAGDVNKAYSYNSTEFQKVTSLEDFKKLVADHPVLAKHLRVSDKSTERVNDEGNVKVIIRTADSSTPVEYKLIKEDKAWMILAFRIGNPIAEDNTSLGGVKMSVEIVDQGNKKNAVNAAPASISLPNIYENDKSRYSVKYPADWEYEVIGKGSVVFTGKKGTASSNTGINIQTILTKKTGGTYSTISEQVNADQEAIVKELTNAKILDRGLMELPKNPKKYQGEYLLFTYTLNGHDMKQMKFFFLSEDGQFFYTWSQASPLEQYSADLPVGKAMYESWTIY